MLGDLLRALAALPFIALHEASGAALDRLLGAEESLDYTPITVSVAPSDIDPQHMATVLAREAVMNRR